ncbi:hypothetical protein KDL44_11520 [bacterium]|nr:hypothetical protein [bacterium]
MLFAVCRMLAVLCAILAGWCLGQSSPDWRADVEATRDDGCMPRLFGIGNGMARLRLFGGNPLAGTGAMLLWLLAGLLLAVYGFRDALDGAAAGNTETGWGSYGIMLLFQPASWIMLGSFAFGYVASKMHSEQGDGPQQ